MALADKPPVPRTAVIGGGIGGLASAYFLVQQGHRPVLFEASDRLAGLGRSFEHRGTTLDCFYHVILDSDTELRSLIAAVGFDDRLAWQRTGMGFYIGGKLYALNTPLDLLRFRALPVADRLRTGLGALYVTRAARGSTRLDEIRACDWLRPIFGARVFERIWRPLLTAKFGAPETVPAYCVWNRLRREKNGGPEIKGYLRGGYQALANRLRDVIVAGGGQVRLRSPVLAVAANGAGVTIETARERERFDAAIGALPLPLLARIATPPLATMLPLPDLKYQGVVNAVVLSRKPLDHFYWSIVIDPAIPFQGLVETTRVIPPAWVGHRHLIYMTNYCDPGADFYRRSDEAIKNDARRSLRTLYPRSDARDVEAVYVFRAPQVEPIWSVGYLRRRPAPQVAGTRLYLSTTAQSYPQVNAWNTSIAVARATTARLLADLSGEARQRAAAWEEAAAA